jgi:hypothetical protein
MDQCDYGGGGVTLAGAVQTSVQLSGSDVFWIAVIFFVVFSGISGTLRRIRNNRRRAAEVRHRRRVQLAMAEAGTLRPEDLDEYDDVDDGSGPGVSPIPPIPRIPPIPPIPPIGVGGSHVGPGRRRPAAPRPPRRDEAVVPAAVIPAPPSARPRQRVIGQCVHDAIVPVITRRGELTKWVCANYPRCLAEFPADVAVYEADPGDLSDLEPPGQNGPLS